MINNIEDDLEGEMSAIKYTAMHARLTSIISCARANMIFPAVSTNYNRANLPVPALQVILNLALDVNELLVTAAGDMINLRKLSEEYPLIFR